MTRGRVIAERGIGPRESRSPRERLVVGAGAVRNHANRSPMPGDFALERSARPGDRATLH
jgi:hypothetical protein